MVEDGDGGAGGDLPRCEGQSEEATFRRKLCDAARAGTSWAGVRNQEKRGLELGEGMGSQR